MIWLLPAAVCSITIAAILKINEGAGGSRLVMMGGNYIVASFIALLMLRGNPGPFDRVTLGIGVLTGADYVISFLVLMAGIGKGPLALPVTVMRLSVVVPVVASIFLWNETPGLTRYGGIALGLAAIVFFGLGVAGHGRKKRATRGFWLLLAAIFISTGLASILLKTFREVSPDVRRLAFTWLLFSSAGILTWLIILLKRIRVDWKTFRLGMFLGLPNLFSTVFTLKALENIPASIVFPFINVTVIFGATLLGLFVWKEKLDRLSTTGLVFAAVSLVLLAS
ncbi:MAG: EamA family transporter [Candidatus Krumholzibacteria bacterium]|nr:EamA family transporter [Candidatus Krumholzibacteria bacterium]